MSYHIFTGQNKRDYQEDRYVNIKSSDVTDDVLEKHDIHIIGVFDGHGGPNISDHISKVLPEYFFYKSIATDNEPKPSKSYNNYIINTFDYVQNEMNAKHQKSTNQGSTVSMILIYDYKDKKYLSTINAGDSRSIGCKQSLIGQTLTKDHKPDSVLEQIRITDLGGTVTPATSENVARINDVLAVSRSMGDFDTIKYVEHKPDIFHYINDYIFVICATDGLWDVMTTDDVCDFVLKELYSNPKSILENKDTKSKDNIASKLAQKAIELKSNDNITILIYFMETNEKVHLDKAKMSHHSNI